jgi:hypothetical protein
MAAQRSGADTLARPGDHRSDRQQLSEFDSQAQALACRLRLTLPHARLILGLLREIS